MTASSVTQSTNTDYQILVGTGIKKPTHNLKLTDVNGTTAGLILCNRSGVRDNLGLTISSMPRTALQTSQKSAGYDDMELPFVAEVQSTMSGGRAQDTLSSDRTKFFDSYRLDTIKEFPVCAPATLAQTGLVAAVSDVSITGDPASLPINGNPFVFQYKFAAETIVTSVDLTLLLPFPGVNIYYKVLNSALATLPTYADASVLTYYPYIKSVPAVSRDRVTVTVNLPFTAVTIEAGNCITLVLDLVRIDGLPLAPQPLVSTTTLLLANSGGIYRLNGTSDTTTWADNCFVGTIYCSNPYTSRLFEYKRQLYAILNNDAKDAAQLYVNGYRGTCTTNSSAMSTTVIKSTTAIAANALADCIVLIINGTGEMEAQPWRLITSNLASTGASDPYSTVLTVSTPWKIAHDYTTEYVILGSNNWTAITTTVGEVNYMTKAVTSVAVVNNFVVFAFGDSQKLSYMHESNVLTGTPANTGTWTRHWAIDTTYYADLLCPIMNENGFMKLWRADTDDSWVDCSDAGDWNTPWTSPPTMLFDVNAHLRADLLLQQQRTKVDYDTEIAKAADKEDAGLLKSYTRSVMDLDYQMNSRATAHTSDDPIKLDIAGTGFTIPDVTYDTSAPRTAHKYLPSKVYCGNKNSKITNILAYSQPEIPYVIKEDGFGSINNNIYSAMPIGEMKSVRAENNGYAAMQYGVYLYFNLAGNMVERYYDQRLDDIGLNRDEGLPVERQGEITKLLPYPGRFYAAVDGGFSGYSTVMCNNLLGWHEIYRSDVIGKRITDICVQTIPGNIYVDRLWICEGTDVVATSIAISPTQQYKYKYHGYRDVDASGYVETSWIDFDLKDVDKYFHSLTIFSDYSGEITTGLEYQITAWFMVDGDKRWNYAGYAKPYEPTTVNSRTSKRSIGVKELELHYDRGLTHDVFGKKIKFKIAMTPMASVYETPILKALVINGVLRMPVKRSWNITFQLEPMKDLQDRPLTDTQGSLYNQLFYWANSKTSATPLTMRTNDTVTDNKTVFIDPASINYYASRITMGDSSGDKEHLHVASMTIYEV